MVVISVANNKGGVGKTTTTMNLGAALANANQRVLLVDLDPQSSLTIYFGYDPISFQSNSYHVITRKVSPAQAIISTGTTFLDLLPASIELASAEIELTAAFSRETILREQLERIRDRYDFVLIDNMPSLGILTVNSLMASDYVIVPIEPTYLAYKGLEMISQTIGEVKRYNTKLELLGAVITMVDERTKHAKDIIARIRESFPSFSPLVRRSVKFADAAACGSSIRDFAGADFEGARAYSAIAAQLLDQVRSDRR